MQRRDFLTRGSSFAIIGVAGTTIGAAMLTGCATNPYFSMLDAVHRLLTLASQRALARLTAPGGFYDSQIARIDLPKEMDDETGKLLTKILLSGFVKTRLLRAVNRAAEEGAARAAPIVLESIRSLNPADAAAILRQGGPAATNLLRASMGNALVTAMLPGVDESLRVFDNDIVQEALKLVTGISFAGLRDDVTRKASDAIYEAIGQEEQAIRADPNAGGDPVLAGALSALARIR